MRWNVETTPENFEGVEADYPDVHKSGALIFHDRSKPRTGIYASNAALSATSIVVIFAPGTWLTVTPEAAE